MPTSYKLFTRYCVKGWDKRDKTHFDTGLTVWVVAKMLHTQQLGTARQTITPVKTPSVVINRFFKKAACQKVKQKVLSCYFCHTFLELDQWFRPVGTEFYVMQKKKKKKNSMWYSEVLMPGPTQSLLLHNHRGLGSSEVHPQPRTLERHIKQYKITVNANVDTY